MILFEEETGKILRACMAVHNELGNGFLEAVYQAALAEEFRDQGIPFVREKEVPVFTKDENSTRSISPILFAMAK